MAGNLAENTDSPNLNLTKGSEMVTDENEKRIESIWSINCHSCSPMAWEEIGDAVDNCGIVEFLAKKLDWGEGAVQNELVLMDDYDPDKKGTITIEIPESLWESHEEELQAMHDKIDDAIDAAGPGWSFNC